MKILSLAKTFFEGLPPWAFGVAVLVVGIFSWWMDSANNRSPAAVEPTTLESLDTYIPKGHVVVPITVENYQALDQILGTYGVVDLYSATKGGTKMTLVAQGVKVTRTPRAPESLNIWIPSGQGGHILRPGAIYSVAIHNPDKGGTKFVNTNARRKRRIYVDSVETTDDGMD